MAKKNTPNARNPEDPKGPKTAEPNEELMGPPRGPDRLSPPDFEPRKSQSSHWPLEFEAGGRVYKYNQGDLLICIHPVRKVVIEHKGHTYHIPGGNTALVDKELVPKWQQQRNPKHFIEFRGDPNPFKGKVVVPVYSANQ